MTNKVKTVNLNSLNNKISKIVEEVDKGGISYLIKERGACRGVIISVKAANKYLPKKILAESAVINID